MSGTDRQAACRTTSGDPGLDAVEPASGRRLSGPVAEDPRATLLIVRTDARHPLLGSGLLLLLELPDMDDAETAARFATGLNRLEASASNRSYVLGGRCLHHTHARPVFASFLPGALHKPLLLTNLALSMAGRVQWLASTLVELCETWRRLGHG